MINCFFADFFPPHWINGISGINAIFSYPRSLVFCYTSLQKSNIFLERNIHRILILCELCSEPLATVKPNYPPVFPHDSFSSSSSSSFLVNPFKIEHLTQREEFPHGHPLPPSSPPRPQVATPLPAVFAAALSFLTSFLIALLPRRSPPALPQAVVYPILARGFSWRSESPFGPWGGTQLNST